MRDGRYIDIPGIKTHELPPLLLHTAAEYPPAESADLSSVMLEAEDMLPAADVTCEILEQRKLDLALQLTEQYKGLLSHWLWGDSILEWIRQCEITFDSEEALRRILHPDVWPHASRASFVWLLIDKHVPTHGVELENFPPAAAHRLLLQSVPVLFEFHRRR